MKQKQGIDILYVGFILGHGGDAIQMLELAAGMAARGRRVKIIVPALETCQDFARRCAARGIPVECSADIHADAFAARQSLPRLFRFFMRHRAQLCHLHTGDVCLPRSVLLVMRLLRMPRGFVTIHSPYNTLEPGDARAQTWAAAVPQRFRQVFCPSAHSRNTQRRYGVPDACVTTIPNSVNVARFGNGDANAARQRLGLPDSARLIVFSSRLDPQKRPLEALEAFVQYAGDFPDTHLVFVGRGALEDEAKTRAQEAGLSARVHFVGYQDNVPDWLAAASVWTFPTESENFSLAVLEALAAGCPIVSTLCQGNDEVLVAEENALTVAIGDVAGQAAAIRRLLTDPELCARLSAAARATSARYDVAHMVAQYESFYESALPDFGWSARASIPVPVESD